MKKEFFKILNAEISREQAQKDSKNWFRKKVKTITDNPPTTFKYGTENQLFNNPNAKLVSTVEIGKMYMFYYDPKYKDILPYYDTLPLIFPFGAEYNSLIGINFHYLPVPQRLILLNSLMTIATDTRMDENTKIRANWMLLKSLSKFDLVIPCVKRYLNNKLASRFLEIPSSEWQEALTLPFERFVNSGKSNVWKHSIGKFK